jgi:hypothetical protein
VGALQALLATPTEFRAAIVRMITPQRYAVRLPEIADPCTDAYVATHKEAVLFLSWLRRCQIFSQECRNSVRPFVHWLKTGRPGRP